MKRYFSMLLAACMILSLAACSSDSAADEETSDAETEESAAEAESDADTQAEEDSDLEEATAQVFAMDTYFELTAYGEDAQDALDEISEEIESLDSRLSVTDEESEVYALNHAEGETLEVSGITASLIEFTQTLNEQTGGALDITVYPLMLAWGFTTQEYEVPSDAEIEELLAYVDESLIEVDGTSVTVPAEMQLDLGSVVKGYACELAEEILAEYGVEHALLNFGGSTIGLVGDKTDGSSWRVAVQDPEDDSAYAGILTVEDVTVDTSGGYERYFTDDEGNVYWHILDPDTGRPADSGLISATIICEDSLMGDALSTACFVMGLEDSIEYWRTYGDFDFVFITEDHEVYVSEGIEDSFELYGDYADAELTVVTE